jgi:hypothetical protein
LCEQLEYNLLCRWFLDMDMLEPLQRRRHTPRGMGVAEEFPAQGPPRGRQQRLGCFPWREKKQLDPRVEDDPEAKLMRKGSGREAKLSFGGHALMENRNGLLVDLQVTEANGRAERQTALSMLRRRRRRRITVGADRGYDTRDFVADCRRRGVTPHVARHEKHRRKSAIDQRTLRHPGYRISQTIRRRIESIFGWLKSVAGLRRTRYRGTRRTQFAVHLAGAAYNLLRVAKLRAST